MCVNASDWIVRDCHAGTVWPAVNASLRLDNSKFKSQSISNFICMHKKQSTGHLSIHHRKKKMSKILPACEPIVLTILHQNIREGSEFDRFFTVVVIFVPENNHHSWTDWFFFCLFSAALFLFCASWQFLSLTTPLSMVVIPLSLMPVPLKIPLSLSFVSRTKRKKKNWQHFLSQKILSRSHTK